MTMFLGFMAVLTLVLWLAPHSPEGRLLHRQLVERPLAALAEFERHHLFYAVILGMMMLGGGEVLVLLGPEFIAAYAMNMALYFDAVLVTYALSAAAMAKTGWRAITSRIPRRVRRPARRRRRASPPARAAVRADNDDDDPAPAILAA